MRLENLPEPARVDDVIRYQHGRSAVIGKARLVAHVENNVGGDAFLTLFGTVELAER